MKDAEASGYDGEERRVATREERRTGLERRRGAGIRREEDRRSAEEGEMTQEQFEFIRAIEVYKRVNNKMFPTWTEVLEVMLQLGYRKVELPRGRVAERTRTRALQGGLSDGRRWPRTGTDFRGASQILRGGNASS